MPVSKSPQGSQWRADLHLHSTASDGKLTPKDLVQSAVHAGMTHIALTDHETMGGLPEARIAAKEFGIHLIPGVEVNTAGEDEVHLLLYFVHEDMAEICSLLERIREKREQRIPQIISKLVESGQKISLSDLDIPVGAAPGRPHVALALEKLGIVRDVKDAFDRFLGVGKPAYVPRKRYETVELITMARRAGAVPVLAHPGLIRNPALASEEAIVQLRTAGLMGLEAYHSQQSEETCSYWNWMARKLGLLVTGGSDFHRENDSHGAIGSQTKRWISMEEDLHQLLKAGETMKK